MKYTYPKGMLEDVQKYTGKTPEEIAQMKPEEIVGEWAKRNCITAFSVTSRFAKRR